MIARRVGLEIGEKLVCKKTKKPVTPDPKKANILIVHKKISFFNSDNDSVLLYC